MSNISFSLPYVFQNMQNVQTYIFTSVLHYILPAKVSCWRTVASTNGKRSLATFKKKYTFKKMEAYYLVSFIITFHF